jgi:2-oxoglutarate ferredoxin oxidoreductase subunit alpha
MMSIDLNILIGGEAGQGVQSVGLLLGKALVRGGYHVFIDQDYESRVRGGHNFIRTRLRDTPVGAISQWVNVLVALNRETITLHHSELAPNSVVIFDSGKINDLAGSGESFGLPLEQLAVKDGGNLIMANTVALGATLGLVSYDLGILKRVLTEHFGEGKVAEGNIAAATAGYNAAQEYHGGGIRQIPVLDSNSRMLLTGNEAISLGAMAAGCKFMAAYPMTPATTIMEYLATKSKEFDMAMVHAEDEIAAVHMAIGASYAGVRAMTATSGGGFCLMTEGLGLSAITETPLVIVDSQRPGPAIGLPTRTEQGDLQFVLNAHHGDFPRVVLAPATIDDCFWKTIKAFNITDRYQTPVIVLTDQHLGSSYNTVEPFDISKVQIDRGSLYSESDSASTRYLRHLVTSTGISPRAFPGRGKVLVVTDSDEHDEAGHLVEDALTRKAQMDKRLNKYAGLRQEIGSPQTYGDEKTDVLLIGWGSTYGALREAVDMLRPDIKIKMLHLNELWPFPSAPVKQALIDARFSYTVENNASGQLARLIRTETGIEVSGKVLKYDGRPFTPALVANAIRKEILSDGHLIGL